MAGYISDDTRKVTTHRLVEMKQRGEKISMLTAYDYTMAQIVDGAGMDVILVGDSASNVMAGNVTTLPITLDQMIYHLQGGFESIQLERAAEHTDFNRVRIRKVDRRITSSAGILCVVHLLGRREPDTVSSRPTVHLGLGAAAEPQQFRPEFLYKVQQASNRGFLLFVSTAKRQAGDVNMKAASSCRVAEITHALRLTKDFRPRHFVQMVLERHWMGNKLQAFIQAAVRLDVQVFGVGVRDVKELLRIAVDCTAVVDFKLYAEMTQTFSVEHKVGRVAVFVNNLTVLIPAGYAIGVVVIVPVRAVTVDNTPAVITANIIFVKAMLAERVRVIPDDILLVKPLGAMIADDSQPVGAVLAEPVSLYFKHIFNRVLCTAVCTNSCFTHWLVLHFI